jgi:hypothetical protein
MALSWFKHGIPYVAKISYEKNGYRLKGTVTVFSYGDSRMDAIRDVVKSAEQRGFTNVTVDHMVRAG